MRKEYKEKLPNNGNNISFQGFDYETVKLNYDVHTGGVSNEPIEVNLTKSAYYFGKHGLLMAITKSNNNGKVNVFATNATVEPNPYDDKNNNHDIFAVYNASQEDAESFINKLNTFPMEIDNYKNIDSQEKFEQFFQDHCKKDKIKIEGKKVIQFFRSLIQR